MSVKTTSVLSATDPHVLAAEFVQDSAPLRYWKGSWWKFDGTKYAPMSREQLDAELVRSIRDYFECKDERDNRGKLLTTSRALVVNTVQAMTGMAGVLVDESQEQPCWLGAEQGRNCVSMGNGLIEIEPLLEGKEAVLAPHSADWFSPVCLPYPYVPGAKCERWVQFLDQVLEGDKERIDLLQEWFGYNLTPDTSQNRFLIMEGEGANGKSVVCDVLTSLLGEENVSHVPLELFGRAFSVASTLGKLANIVPEVSDVSRVAEGVLKQFVGGDRMEFEQKYKNAFAAKPTARLTIATNQQPGFMDRSNGIWRRMLLMPFTVTIPEEQQDKTLTAKLTGELPGIFLWAIEGLRRLRKQERFTEPAVCKAALKETKLQANPARQFLVEECESSQGDRVVSSDLFIAYTEWCRENGHQPLLGNQFGAEVRRAFPAMERKRVSIGSGGNRPWAYTGLRKAVPVSQQTQQIPINLN